MYYRKSSNLTKLDNRHTFTKGNNLLYFRLTIVNEIEIIDRKRTWYYSKMTYHEMNVFKKYM